MTLPAARCPQQVGHDVSSYSRRRPTIEWNIAEKRDRINEREKVKLCVSGPAGESLRRGFAIIACLDPRASFSTVVSSRFADEVGRCPALDHTGC